MKEDDRLQEARLSQAMDQHGDAVYRLALCRLQNTHDAEDVYQETFLRLFLEDADEWDAEHMKAWLLRVAMNLCRDIGRKRKTRNWVSLEEVAEIPDGRTSEYTELWDAVNRLPEKYRMVFHLHYAQWCKTEDIAKILKIPAATVRVRLSRARTILRKELETYDLC